jgi:hypothetical protein
MAVIFKDGVRVKRLTPALLRLLVVVEQADRQFDEDMVITSVNDSRHAETSAHYRDEALDLRCNDRPRHVDLELCRFLEGTLGPRFLVLYEGKDTPNEHIHLQLRKGAHWP